MLKISKEMINQAHLLIKKHLEPTPLVYNRWLSEKYGCEVWLKLENMQPIGSFKIRGATNKIASLSKSEKQKGVLAVSAGNHAQGVAWAAKVFNTQATIIMPVNAPITKVESTKALGAKVILHGNNVEDAFAYAKDVIKKTGAIFVHPFEDEKVIAGQATCALEIMESQKDFDYIIGSIGGGGLVSGLGLALKFFHHKAKIIGAQASGANAMVESIRKKKVIRHETSDTFADGIKVKVASPVMYELLKNTVDEVYDIADEQIAFAVLELMEKARIVAEGAGALPLAVLNHLHQKNPKSLKNKKVVLVICGGNIDVNLLGHIIGRGLSVSGRHLRLNIFVTDRPGTLNLLTSVIADLGGNILQVIHDHENPKCALNEAVIDLTLETKGEEHSLEIIKALKKHFPKMLRS